MKKICLLVLIFISSLTGDAFGLTAPTLSVTEETNTSISLTWVDKSIDEDGYGVQLKTKAGYVDIDTLPPNTTSYNVSGLTPNSSYIYRVVAYISSPLQLEPSNDISGHTTHTWSGELFNCLEGATSAPPTRTELQTIDEFICKDKALTDIDPISDLENLIWLYVGQNSITGPIPGWISSLTDLRYLELNDNALTGPLPVELFSMPNLEYLYLANNQLTGPIPPEIAGMTNLFHLSLTNNPLNCPLPREIGSMTSLSTLNLNICQLTGSIPQEISNLTGLRYLNLSNNSITGSIPPEIGSMTNLKRLVLSNCQLTGSIPLEIGNMTSLEYLYLNGNHLCGEIPTTLSNLINLIDNDGLQIITNHLSTDDNDLNTFLVLKGGDWESSQTEIAFCPSFFSWNLFLPAIIGRH